MKIVIVTGDRKRRKCPPISMRMHIWRKMVKIYCIRATLKNWPVKN